MNKATETAWIRGLVPAIIMALTASFAIADVGKEMGFVPTIPEATENGYIFEPVILPDRGGTDVDFAIPYVLDQGKGVAITNRRTYVLVATVNTENDAANYLIAVTSGLDPGGTANNALENLDVQMVIGRDGSGVFREVSDSIASSSPVAVVSPSAYLFASVGTFVTPGSGFA